jgi:hypothetical protein
MYSIAAPRSDIEIDNIFGNVELMKFANSTVFADNADVRDNDSE